METKDLIKVGLVGAIGWFVWSKYGEQLGLPTMASLLPGGSEPIATPTTPTPAPAPTINLRSLMLAKANVTNPAEVLMSADDWGWFYSEVRGNAAPQPETYLDGNARTMKLSIDEFLFKSGVSGLGSIQPYAYSPNYLRIPKKLGDSGRVANG
jgi:hypothetical protein